MAGCLCLFVTIRCRCCCVALYRAPRASCSAPSTTWSSLKRCGGAAMAVCCSCLRMYFAGQWAADVEVAADAASNRSSNRGKLEAAGAGSLGMCSLAAAAASVHSSHSSHSSSGSQGAGSSQRCVAAAAAAWPMQLARAGSRSQWRQQNIAGCCMHQHAAQRCCSHWCSLCRTLVWLAWRRLTAKA